MRSLSEVRIEEFDAALTPRQLRLLRVVSTIIVLGKVVFAAVLTALYGGGSAAAPTPFALGIVRTASVVHVVLFGLSCPMAGLLYEVQLWPRRLVDGVGRELRGPTGRWAASPAERCLELIRRAVLYRFLLLDGAALFGAVVSVYAAATGVLNAYPGYWLNASSSLFLFAYVLFTFPTAERVRAIFLRRIAGAPRPTREPG
jgi:hypothetical protein